MMRWIFAAAALTAQPAVAAPTYLNCSVDNETSVAKIDIALDEQAQTAVFSSPAEGKTQTRAAAFTAQSVTIPDTVFTWTIDRVSLALTRVTTIGEKRWDDRGQCKIAPVPANRAF